MFVRWFHKEGPRNSGKENVASPEDNEPQVIDGIVFNNVFTSVVTCHLSLTHNAIYLCKI